MQVLDGLRRQQNEQLLAILEEEQAKEAEREVRMADVYQQKDKVLPPAPAPAPAPAPVMQPLASALEGLARARARACGRRCCQQQGTCTTQSLLSMSRALHAICSARLLSKSVGHRMPLGP